VPAINKALRPILSRLAARYLTTTDEKGRALDRVAHFHLGNGAVVERLNWLADTSANGLKQSYAMMVNYRYKLGDVDSNHEAYATGRIVASRDVRALAKG
jgi:malonyl-CoA decarboxylase